jgi:hypothetical protein
MMWQLIRRFFLVIIVIFQLTCIGCASLIDASGSSKAGAIIYKEYELNKNSFMFETYCVDTGEKATADNMCSHIQAQNYCDGDIFELYESNSELADKRLRNCLGYRIDWLSPYPKRIYGKIRLVGLLPKKTKIKVTKVYNYQLGTMGRCWIVKAKIVDGKFADKVIELPSCIGKEPKWVEPIWVHKTELLKVKQEYLSEIQ